MRIELTSGSGIRGAARRHLEEAARLAEAVLSGPQIAHFVELHAYHKRGEGRVEGFHMTSLTNRAVLDALLSGTAAGGDGSPIITLKVVDDRNRFDVNRRAAEQAGLQLSAKLLRLANTIIQD